jgi:hypothetical protein
MNTQLMADAVRNSRGQAEATVWDRLFAFWFRRLVRRIVRAMPDLFAIHRAADRRDRAWPAGKAL